MSAEQRDYLRRRGFKLVEQIFEKMNLSSVARMEILGVSRREYKKLLSGEPAQREEVVDRYVVIIDIWYSLLRLLQNEDKAIAWITSKNNGQPFGGKPVLTLMRKNYEGLRSTKAYVEQHAFPES